MNKVPIVSLFLLLTIISACSTKVDVEKVSAEICACMGEVPRASVEHQNACYEEAFSEMTDRVQNDDLLDSITVRVIKHLGRNCEALARSQIGIANGSFTTINKDQESKLTTEQCRQFNNDKHYYYFEGYGDTTLVHATKDLWEERFPDGSFSRLKFNWTEGCSYENVFIESNHYLKKYLSTPSEVYHYKVIDVDTLKRQYTVYAYPGKFIVEMKINY